MKWYFHRNSLSGMRPLTRTPNKKLLVAAFFALAAGSIVASFLLPRTASADTGSNYLLLVGKDCHDLHEITHDFGPGECHKGNDSSDNSNGWQETLHNSLGCSDDMFYQHANTKPGSPDKSDTTTLWYTKQADYKDCYNKALAAYTAMTDPNGICAVTKDGSDNNKTCESYQNNLHDALGCDSRMFQKANAGGNPDSNGGYWIIKPDTSGNCKHNIDAVGNIHITIIGSDGQPTDSQYAISDDNVPSTDPSDNGGNGQDDTGLSCDTNFDSPLSWIICPVVDVMVTAINKTDTLITNQMNIKTDSIFCTDDDACQAYYSAWSSFRNISLGLMAVAGLTIVIAQAIGFEVLDAYTIRKTLPRLLVAAVAITLSWTVMNFLVSASNDLGFGVRNLIVAPFKNFTSTISLNFSSSSVVNLLGGGGVAVAAVPAWITFGGIGALFSYVATAGLAILVAILVLILRQIVVIMLILLSPIALVAYVLPNTQRIYKLWWESFSRALLMFPMIAALIATGRVFAAISFQADKPIPGLIGFISYFAPYFMIPLTFKFAGGAMSGFGNLINQRAQGGFSALAGFRSNQRKQRVAAARSGGLYRGANRFTKGLNTIGDYTLGADENLAYDFGSGNRLGKIGKGKYNPIGRAGKALLGRRADELKGQIGHATTEHTLKAAQKANLHYSAGWAALGMLGDDQGGSGLTKEGREFIDKKYGSEFDENGNATAWNNEKLPKNGDYEGLRTLGEELHHYSVDGSHAQYAGQELMAKAGTLSSFGLDGETKRATLQSVAGLVVAQEGKMSAEQSDKIFNDSIAGHGHNSVEHAVADDLRTQREQAASQQGHDLRRGKGSRLDKNGQAYSVYSKRLIDEGDGRGEQEAYKSTKALDAILTMKPGALSAGKGDIWGRIGDTVDYWGTDKAVDEASARYIELDDAPDTPDKAQKLAVAEKRYNQAVAARAQMRELVVQQSSFYAGSDPGSRIAAAALKERMGITNEETRAIMGGVNADDAIAANAGADAAGAGAGDQGGGGDPGGAGAGNP